MKNDKQPEIRLPNYKGLWSQRKFEDFVSKAGKKNTINQNYMSYSVSNKVGLVSQAEQFEGSRLDNLDKTSYKIVHPGEFAYNPARINVGSIAFNNLNKTVIVSSLYVVLKMSEKLDNEFILQFIKSPNFNNEVRRNTEGSVREYLFFENFKNIKFPLPSNKDEQVEIGKFFNILDENIKLQQQELDTLIQTKQGFMQKMFPKEGESVPELRFPGFSEEWKAIFLKDVATFINGRSYKQPELLSSGKYKVLRVGNFYTNKNWYYSDLELDEKYYANTGDLLYTWSASFGPHIWQGEKVIYHYHIWKVEIKSGFDKQFAVQLFEYDKAKILNDKNGSTMVHITKKGMEDKRVLLPSIEEQIQIGNFFKQLDNVINLKQQELDALKQTKKAFLQKMFV